MARPLPVPGVDPDRRLRPNARRILAVRIAEAWSYADAVQSPGRVRELHDMRIAFKRVRYLLEIFGVAFRTDLTPVLEEVRGMQDLLGEIHDCDVQIPMLQAHLDRLRERDEAAARELVIAAGQSPPSAKAGREADFRRFAERLEASSTAAQRPGIVALLARRTKERDALYARFLAEWRRWETEGLRTRLASALGIDDPVASGASEIIARDRLAERQSGT